MLLRLAGWQAKRSIAHEYTPAGMQLRAAALPSTLYLGCKKHSKRGGGTLQLATASIDRRALPLPTAEGYYYVRVGNRWNKIASFFF